jgi:hypothetical protein
MHIAIVLSGGEVKNVYCAEDATVEIIDLDHEATLPGGLDAATDKLDLLDNELVEVL